MGTSSDSAGSPKWGAAKGQATSAIAAGALTTAKIEQIVSSFVQGLQQTPESGFGPVVPEIPGTAPGGVPDSPTAPSSVPPTVPGGPAVAPQVRLGAPVRTGGHGGGGGRGGERSSGGGGTGGGGGGGRGGSRGGRGGRSGGGVRGAARSLAQFITTVAEAGLAKALAEVGLISLEDKSPSEIASTIVSTLCGPNSTIDQVDLHNAMAATMDKLLGDAKEFKECELALEHAAPTLLETLATLFGNYIYERFCSISYANVHSKNRS